MPLMSLLSRNWLTATLSTFLLLAAVPRLLADEFLIEEDDGKHTPIDARVAGETQGYVALERRDGRIEVVGKDRVVKQGPAPDPTPLTPAEMLE